MALGTGKPRRLGDVAQAQPLALMAATAQSIAPDPGASGGGGGMRRGGGGGGLQGAIFPGKGAIRVKFHGDQRAIGADAGDPDRRERREADAERAAPGRCAAAPSSGCRPGRPAAFSSSSHPGAARCGGYHPAPVLQEPPMTLPIRLAVVLALAALAGAWAADAGAPSFAVATTLKVGGEGRWDYLVCDPTGQRLYVPRSTHVQVLDAASGALLADIPGTPGVHGVALVPEVGRGFTSNGGDGTVTIFDLATAHVLGTVAAAADADCIIYDPASRKVLAFCGDANVVVPIPADLAVTGAAEPAVALGGAPEYAVADGLGRVYVNLVDRNEVAVLDTRAMAVVARWPTAPGTRPTAMAMDPATRRLFVGCRNQKLVVMDATGGQVLADLAIGSGVDATAFTGGCALASCGDGTLSVARADAAGRFAVIQTVPTRAGARTMAIDPHGGRVYLPTADLAPAPAPSAATPHPRPQPVPGSFAIVVVARAGG